MIDNMLTYLHARKFPSQSSAMHNLLKLLKEQKTDSNVRIMIIRCIVDVAIAEMNPAISDRGSSITTKCLEDLGILQQDNWNGRQLNKDFVEYGSEDGVTDADKEMFALETLVVVRCHLSTYLLFSGTYFLFYHLRIAFPWVSS
jgi:hypothetical protein